ncbi:DedA family protein [Cryobacterium sp. Y29]|uniref:DedA family protein n=1 Tax=Cryobacterium sp. Y29 TaxID=2048285 RepID=UPI001304C64B|nr:DedA family protein [Cryobacterium sp. Y29]
MQHEHHDRFRTAHLRIAGSAGGDRRRRRLGLVVVCAIVFVETGLLVGFFLPGDTLLFFTGVLTFSGVISQPLWGVIPAIALSAALGDQLGYTIGRTTGRRIFDRRDSGLFSRKSVTRTQEFFDRFGPAAVTIARFVPVVIRAIVTRRQNSRV